MLLEGATPEPLPFLLHLAASPDAAHIRDVRMGQATLADVLAARERAAVEAGSMFAAIDAEPADRERRVAAARVALAAPLGRVAELEAVATARSARSIRRSS